MPAQYFENPLLFVTSTDANAPKGRNVRAQVRTQQAAQLAPASSQTGKFALINFNVKRPSTEDENKTKHKRKKSKKALFYPNGETSPKTALSLPITEDSPTDSVISDPYDILRVPPPPPNPTEILAVATFHIRRLAAMTVRNQPSRLTEVLRCRQWSCVSIAIERFGKSTCLDSALLAVASKLHQMTGGTASPLHVLSTYADALKKLQTALMEPGKHDHHDLMTTTQLLAVYEMLDSLEDGNWVKHVNGAGSLYRPQFEETQFPYQEKDMNFAEAAPLFTDALLNENYYFFQHGQWESALEEFVKDSALPDTCRELISCLFEIVPLLLETKAQRNMPDYDRVTATNLQDRAHMLRSRLKKGLLESDIYFRTNYWLKFDKLGLYLAALVALDRLIASLRPVEVYTGEDVEDKTAELCAQLLQLELGTADAYAATDLMVAFQNSTFQLQAGYVIALPGPQNGW